MAKRVDRGKGESAPDPLAVDAPVVVFPGTDQQQGGVIVEDFGDSAGQAVEIGGNQIAGAAADGLSSSTTAPSSSSTASRSAPCKSALLVGGFRPALIVRSLSISTGIVRGLLSVSTAFVNGLARVFVVGVS